MSFKLMDLPYSSDSLSPYISKDTVDVHYGKHHKTYVDNLNKFIEGTSFEGKSLENIVKDSYNVAEYKAIYNNAAQVLNHNLFWNSMNPKEGREISDTLNQRIVDDFKSVGTLRDEFISKGMSVFGSGWVWLTLKDDKLSIEVTSNGDNPILNGSKVLLVCDVWEHSYYLDYKNLRLDYLKSWINNLANWQYVEDML